jgi:hypothetical protein
VSSLELLKGRTSEWCELYFLDSVNSQILTLGAYSTSNSTGDRYLSVWKVNSRNFAYVGFSEVPRFVMGGTLRQGAHPATLQGHCPGPDG